MILKNMTAMFYFDVDVQYKYNVTTIQSKTYEQISRDIREAIAQKLAPFYRGVQLGDVIVFLLLLLVFVK